MPDWHDSGVYKRYVRRLMWRPSVAAANLHKIEAELTDLPLFALDIFIANPGLRPDLLDVILANAEASERFLYWHREQIDLGGDPAGLGSDFRLGKSAFAGEPDRYLRTLEFTDDSHSEEIESALLKILEQFRAYSPGWSLFWLSHTDTDSGTSEGDLPQDIIESLCKDEERSYLALKILAGRAYDGDGLDRLEQAIRSPKWAYHLLRDHLASDRIRLLEIVCRDPAWLVQYCADANVPVSEIGALYLRCIETVPEHELIPDLHYWYRSVASYASDAAK